MSRKLATVDLGSNSFHMLISEMDDDGQLKEVYRGKSKVQLRSGLTDENGLTEEAKARALDCLRNFSLSIQHYEVDTIKVIGTYTLRKAQENISDFIAEAEAVLGAPIEIISGEEEARLVYVGASSVSKVGKKKALIVDIGGGSTELVIGKNRNLKVLNSLEMGCVSMQNQFFGDGMLTFTNFAKAIDHARSLIDVVAADYIQQGWEAALGSSGTIISISEVAKANQWSDGEITRDVLEQLIAQLLTKKTVSEIHFNGLRADRENILAGGISVLYAIFDRLGIKSMSKSDGALREGMLFELVNKLG